MHPFLQTLVQHFLQHDLEHCRGLLLKTLLTEMIAWRIRLSIWFIIETILDLFSTENTCVTQITHDN